jgi:hypothetical protein
MGAETPAKSLIVYTHSPLLYWWPVWAVGFIMAAWTILENRHMVLVPEGALAADAPIAAESRVPLPTPVHVSASNVPGTVFALTVITVLAFSGGWLRGWQAYTFLAAAVAAVMLINWVQGWPALARWAGLVRVHISLGGYLLLSTAVFLLWTWQVFVADRWTYVAFSMSQVRVHSEVGQQEQAYDAGGVSFEKQPYDWFRRLIGFGAGDLRMRVGGQWIELPNVIRVASRLEAIETMLRTKDVE